MYKQKLYQGGSWYHDTASCVLTCKNMVLQDPPTFGTDTNLYLAHFRQGPTPICKQTGPDSTINCRKCRNFSNVCVRIKHINHLSRFEKYKSTFHILLYIKFNKNNKYLQVKITQNNIQYTINNFQLNFYKQKITFFFINMNKLFSYKGAVHERVFFHVY